MTRNFADAQQLATLRNILNEYCELAGIPGPHPMREQLAQRLMILFGEGTDDFDDVKRELDLILKGLRADIVAVGHAA